MANKVKKHELGQGIKALLNNYDRGSTTSAEVVREVATTDLRVPIDQIEINPFQPRKAFDEDQLQELAASIEALDIVQPLTLRRLDAGRYQLISGERRLRAARLAGLDDVPAYIRVADDQGMLEMAIVENVQRADLNPIETAIAYQRLLDECGLRHEDLSKRLGKRRSTVTNVLRLLKLPPQVQAALAEGRISAGHGRALAGLDDTALQLALLAAIEREGLSVRQTEEQVRRASQPPTSRATASASQLDDGEDIRRLQSVLSSRYGAKVRLRRQPDGRGQIVIHFGDDGEFSRLMEQLQPS